MKNGKIFILLTIVAIILKIIGCINWDWVWVFSLIWIPCAFTGFLVMMAVEFFPRSVIEAMEKTVEGMKK